MSEYRASAAQCPACASIMDERAAGDAIVDVCPGCRGLWIDWFDGDTVQVAVDAAPLSMRAPAPNDLSRAACPRCKEPMEFATPSVESHAAAAAARMGAVLLRCGTCAGTFVPRAAFDDLVALRDHTPVEPDSRTSLQKFLDAVRDLFRPAHFDDVDP